MVGGGHAGCEAAATAARLGSRVLLITMDLNRMAQMSCNPAIGGIGKGQIVREIDALGGLTGVITDLTTIHFRMLNRSKGPAMWSPRAQCDKLRFSMQWRNMLATFPTLSLLHDTVVSIDTVGCVVSGVRTKNGFSIRTRAVVLTAGTFLNGCIHIGSVSYNGGRIGEKSKCRFYYNFCVPIFEKKKIFNSDFLSLTSLCFIQGATNFKLCLLYI